MCEECPEWKVGDIVRFEESGGHITSGWEITHIQDNGQYLLSKGSYQSHTSLFGLHWFNIDEIRRKANV